MSKLLTHVTCVRVEHEWEKLFGRRIRELRRLRGWTQDELGQFMSGAGFQMHQTTVAKMENGTRPTSVAEVGALATLLEVPIGALFSSADHAEKHQALKGLEYKLKILTAEADKLTEQREELRTRIEQLSQELADTMVEYDSARTEYEAAIGQAGEK